MVEALRDDLGQEVLELWHKDHDISAFNSDDCIVLPGGFSFGDYLRCGAIAKFSPMMQSVIGFANKGGKVLGVCNGFQILCEAGLLPGVLLRNASQQFICRNIYVREGRGYDTPVLKIPIAHGEGRFYADEATIESIEMHRQVIYRYCNELGHVHNDHNYNGSTNSIAGICNKERNVYGMMPHPERACSDELGNVDGKKVFQHLFNIN